MVDREENWKRGRREEGAAAAAVKRRGVDRRETSLAGCMEGLSGTRGQVSKAAISELATVAGAAAGPL